MPNADPSSQRRSFTLQAGLLAGSLAGAASPALAQQVPATAASTAPAVSAQRLTLADCAAIGPAADRLACYDGLAGRAPADPTPASPPPPPAAAEAVPATSTLAPKDAPLAPANSPDGERSLLSKYWELDPQDKRGTFNFVGYRPNYVLPVRFTNNINRNPSSPTQAAVSQPNARRIEAKFQVSLRTKAAQGLVFPNADLWLAFTQQATWQVYNGADSKPFRNTDYEPEATYVLATSPGLRSLPFGWQWRYTQLGIAHQSNGQSDPLSRSWNRVYLGAGFERGDWSFTTRFLKRIKESIDTDNNPDLVDYRGRGEFQVNWAPGLSTASLLYRTTLKNGHYGALQFEYTYPVLKEQPNGLRWYMQVFSGYGETLTDYNFRQTSVGLGVTFLQF
ncbi:phospholipase A [Aquincola sp. J276]|uniref:phospholipase A n=1 Tax=Aquincola sp. J276 TaxID=2898432 RepID=UPI002150928D|nr:phospholipase A [Aquincola sp. J276]MCR5867007.1 phospholipase A [Aquincola sp. J276]